MRKICLAGFLGLLAPAFCNTAAPAITVLSRTYQLASFHEKPNAIWEFVPAGESIDAWKSLVTIVDRPDARTKPDLDRLAQGVDDNYKAHGGRILMAKTMQDHTGAPYNYMVVAFEEPAQHRFELSFVKIALGQKNAYVLVYGARVTDLQDYKVKGKDFLNRHSGEIGRALEAMVLPEIAKLPRREF